MGKFRRGVVAVREFLTSRSGRGRIRRTDRSNVGERNCAGKGGRSRWWGESSRREESGIVRWISGEGCLGVEREAGVG